MHTALQLCFIFSASLEDYQPEASNGQKNISCNPFYFNRCARLLQNIERAVIYGSHTLSNNEEKALKRRATVDADAEELADVKKREIANKISRAYTQTNFDGALDGQLLYKRVERKSSFQSKSWKTRYFVVDQRMLLCFKEPHSVNPLRSLPLQSCEVEVINNNPKHGDTCFNIINYSNNIRFQLRALDTASRDKWVSFLQK